MHGIIISPMIYNVKRIYICLSDIFKLFQDFSREIQAIIRPHTNSHTILRFTKQFAKHTKKYRDETFTSRYFIPSGNKLLFYFNVFPEKIMATKRFIQCNRDRICKIKRAKFAYHGNTHGIVVIGIDEFFGQSLCFLSKQ